MIISEIGQNHMGDMELAKELIRQSKEGGADLVKSQLFDSMALYGEKKATELSFIQAEMLFLYAEFIGIEMFFSVFDVERVKWCEKIGVKRYKIACSQNRNSVLYDTIRATRKPAIISYEQTYELGRPGIGLICVPRYPAWVSDVEWAKIQWGLDYDGFSDHTIGLDAAKIALARGAQIIEKHFSIDHMTGVDAPWSMDLEELKELKRWETVCQEVLGQ